MGSERDHGLRAPILQMKGKDMVKEFLIAVDLEGIHGVLGDPYKPLTDSHDYKLACENAVKEANAVCAVLFDMGAEKVTVWDNHGAWHNMDAAAVDPRAHFVNGDTPKSDGRIFFAPEHDYCAMICLGYHSKEGAIGGVLAHTYSSVAIQYYKINGKTVGELEVDQYTAAEYGFSIAMVASDEAGVNEAREAFPGVRSVITKYGVSRNEARLLDWEEVKGALEREAREAFYVPTKPERLAMPASFEVRYTRTEDAKARLERLLAKGFDAHFVDDAHTISYTLSDIADVFA